MLAVSAVWITAFPRADQPLLDVAEHFAPRLRSAYMDVGLLAVAEEAQRYAQRHRRSAEELQRGEAQRRWSGEALDELELRRVASFLKSYHEMTAGESFVAREVRGRAREAHRLAIAAALLALAWTTLVLDSVAGWVVQPSKR